MKKLVIATFMMASFCIANAQTKEQTHWALV